MACQIKAGEGALEAKGSCGTCPRNCLSADGDEPESAVGLWQQQFHQLLVEIYTGFSGGFNARDLQDAKAMLAELACGLVGRLLGGLAARQVTILPDSIRMQSSHRQRPALHPL